MIKVSDLRKTYATAQGEIHALDGVNLTIDSGEIHGIVGPSGAGKSTLVRCLTGLVRPTSGSVHIDGVDVSALSGKQLRAQRRNIGMVFQDINLFDSRTATENIAYPLRIAKVPVEERAAQVAKLLELVGLEGRGDSVPAQLSGGQRQRVGIARALAANPSVLLCDEPSSALDWATTRQILELISKVRDELGVTVLIITHEMSVVRQVCDSVSRLSAGRITESGQLLDIVTEGKSTLARELIPLASPPVGTSHSHLDITFSSHRISVPDALRFMADLSESAKIVAATVESLGGAEVGRFQLDIASSQAEEISRKLTEFGLSVEKAAA